jgi:hypothetical protein
MLDRYLHRLIEIGALQDVKSRDLLLGLRERAIRYQHLALADADRGGVPGREQLAPAREKHTTSRHLLHPCLDVINEIALRMGELATTDVGVGELRERHHLEPVARSVLEERFSDLAQKDRKLAIPGWERVGNVDLLVREKAMSDCAEEVRRRVQHQ